MKNLKFMIIIIPIWSEMARITVSLSESLFEAIERIVKEGRDYRQTSHLVADALEEFLRVHYPEFTGSKGEEGEVFPTILWKLKVRRKLRAPSPRVKGRRLAGEWVVVR